MKRNTQFCVSHIQTAYSMLRVTLTEEQHAVCTKQLDACVYYFPFIQFLKCIIMISHYFKCVNLLAEMLPFSNETVANTAVNSSWNLIIILIPLPIAKRLCKVIRLLSDSTLLPLSQHVHRWKMH